MWRNRKFWGIIAVILILIGVGAYYYKSSHSTVQQSYTTGKVERGNISTIITATGTINPVNYVDISTNVAGMLESVLVKENQHVTKGQVIATIDSRQLQAAVDDAKASLDTTKVNLDRYEVLLSQGAISQQAYDNAREAYEKALAAYNKSEAVLNDSTITSPMDGTVIGTPLKVGQTISTGISTQMIIATVADLSNLEIYLTVDETDIGSIRKGAKVEFTVDAHPGKTYTGTVSDISLGTKGNMGTTSSTVVYYTVKVAIPSSEASDFFPTMTARATIYGDEQTNVLVVPLAAVRTDKVGEYVYVIKNGQPERTSVTTGITGDTTIQITKGLNEGDEIVVSGDVSTSTKKASSGGPMF
ncbi:MAG: efflux RND transporter periplasmic adaptor subunit [Veillonella sp.]|uniref:efflux RND transporter periplasmic adaptor subunit n=1 Tax=Veillonella sp. TaxID=1926307 RepID=UPI0025EE1E26|nr:efflux RND transporter periplasmic adaptor subunit [Veillonella sp.]MBS4913877.1 efflux RND transporter periplasmic adaptor subunit [Veillonella sp.]